MRTIRLTRTAVLSIVVALVAASSNHALGASDEADVLITIEVASHTTIDTLSGCATGTPDVTDLGPVLPGFPAFSGTDCTIEFGSSNDTAVLRLFQSDQVGDAMYAVGDGRVDESFDGPPGEPNHPGDGIVWMNSDASQADWFEDVVAQPDGMLVAVGRNQQAGDTEPYIVRLDTDGTWDGGFNSTGSHVVTATAAEETFMAVALQPDGRIVAAGSIGNGTDLDMAVARFMPDGTLDQDFDGAGAGDGIVLVDFAGEDDVLNGVAIQDDGMIVAAGVAHEGGDERAVVIRLDEGGALDPAFDGPAGNGDGIANLNHSNSEEYYNDVAIDASNRIVAVGVASDPSQMMRVTRLLPASGALDTDFDGPGGADGDIIANLPLGWVQSYARAVDIDAEGRIVLGGRARSDATNYNHVVVRLMPADGSLDPSFDGYSGMTGFPGNGAANWDSGGSVSMDITQDVLALPSGQVMFAGRSRPSCDDVTYGRLDEDGSLDTSFDGDSGTADGVVVLDLDPVGSGGCHQELHALAAMPDGRVALVGSENFERHPLVLVVGGESVPDYQDDPLDLAGNDWDTDGAGLFGVCLEDFDAPTTVNIWQPATVTCSDTDTEPWHAVPQTSAGPDEEIAQEAPGQATGTVHLRFGMQAEAAQPPGRYAAPITFEAFAPNV